MTPVAQLMIDPIAALDCIESELQRLREENKWLCKEVDRAEKQLVEIVCRPLYNVEQFGRELWLAAWMVVAQEDAMYGERPWWV